MDVLMQDLTPQDVSQSLDDQVIVVGHPAVGITYPVHPLADLSEDIEECLSVPIVQVNSRTVIAMGGDMIDRTRKLYAQWSSHGVKDSARMC
jgi:hypothetical protein